VKSASVFVQDSDRGRTDVGSRLEDHGGADVVAAAERLAIERNDAE
jgi:hypothetical protein